MADRAEQKQFIADVFSRAAETYDNLEVPHFSVFGQRLVELAGLLPGMRVLDVGTGRGAALFPAAEAVGPTGQVTGIDLAADIFPRDPDADPDADPLPEVARPAGLQTALLETGFRSIEQVGYRHDRAFRNPEHWWAWAWSHGQRIAWERVPADEVESVRAEAFGALARFAAPDGTVPMWNEVCFTTAVKP